MKVCMKFISKSICSHCGGDAHRKSMKLGKNRRAVVHAESGVEDKAKENIMSRKVMGQITITASEFKEMPWRGK